MLPDGDAMRRSEFDGARDPGAWFVGLLLSSLFWCLPAVAPAADPAAPAPKGAPRALPRAEAMPLDDLPEPLVQRSERTEQDEDHLHALAHFSAGRACQRRKEYAPAIRHYQRALRYEPTATGTVWPIVALAERLHWRDVRNRYLLQAAKLDPEAFDPADLIELADLVSSREELRLLIRLFDKALAERKGEKKSTLDIVLRWRLAEVCVAAEEYAKAADSAAGVLDALEHPESYGITRDKLKQWFGSPHPPYWLFGEYFLMADRLVEAERTFEKAHQTSPDAGRLHFHLARISLKRDEPRAALEHLEACFREKPADEGRRPYQLLKKVLARQGKSGELPGRIEKLLAARPDDPALAGFAAEHYLDAGQLDEAAKLYESMLKRQGDSTAYAGLVKIYRKQGQVDKLLKVLNQAAAEDPSLDNVTGQMKTLASDVVLLDKLFATANKRLSQNPAALGAHAPLALAQLAIEAKRPELAAWFYERAVRSAPEIASDVLLLWGGNLMATDDYDGAAAVFRRGATDESIGGDKSIFNYYLASTLALGGHVDEALTAAREACRLNRDSPLLASHEGWILYHGRQNDAARAAYEKFIKRFDRNHSSSGVRRVVREARLILSHLDVQQKDYQQAAQRLEEVLDEFPDDISATNDLAYLWADQQMHQQRALRMARRAVEAEPDNAAYRDSLGWALFRVGRLQEAVVELQRAAEQSPEGEVLDHLGEVYFKLGRNQHAADVWAKAAEAFRKDGHPDAATAIESKIKTAVPAQPAAENDKN